MQDWQPGKAFEYLVPRAFQLEGLRVEYWFTVRAGTNYAIDEEMDGLLEDADARPYLVQSKDESRPIGFEPIAKLRTQLLRRPQATMGIVFSRTGFTEPAIRLTSATSPSQVLLWNGDQFDDAFRRRLLVKGLRAKYRAAVKYGLCDYDPRVGLEP